MHNVTEPVVYKHLYGKKEDRFHGRVIGGCIDVLRHLMGTPYDHTKEFCAQ